MTESKDTEKSVIIYTDGSCLGNPGPGGWAAVLLWNENRKEISGGFKLTTNNRMEVLAVIKSLEALKRPCRIELFTDSKYMHDAIVKKWIRGWMAKGWKTAAKKPVKNQDLWKRLLPLLEKHDVRFHWVRGHNGTVENERCDELAKQAALKPNLPVDAPYEAK